ncbi:MAG TPA: hypothetical protein VEX68_24185 [Bryobacteraceae bacterium]|nr:hypothetical protein [Bryobacteraceae bacterium]
MRNGPLIRMFAEHTEPGFIDFRTNDAVESRFRDAARGIVRWLAVFNIIDGFGRQKGRDLRRLIRAGINFGAQPHLD